VTWTAAVRQRRRTLAARHHARFRQIEVVCADQDVRLEASFARYEAWQDGRLLLDSARPLDELVRAAVAYVTGAS